MKVLLTTLNAKYVHTSLGLWYIYQYCHRDYPEVVFKEYNINQELSWICGEIYLEKAAVVAFSCNIWNIEPVLILCRRLKQVAPETVIILGGPEASNEAEGILERNPAVDFIQCGEGELSFKAWLQAAQEPNPDWSKVAGLVYRRQDEIIHNQSQSEIADLGQIPYPYPEDLLPFQKKLVYYETTRGCPFNCQYCLSANEGRVRYFPLERVKQDLLRFGQAGIRQVKLVDRSFNCNLRWAKEIWNFLLEHPSRTNYHFEVVGNLLDDESLELLAAAPEGFFQFEIGVQSTNKTTLGLIQRQMDLEKLFRQVGRLIQETKVFVHLDLIAGLPGEDYQSFANSFNQTIALRPHRLQLGFLKLLKGSGLRAKAAEYGYEYTAEAPYEVLKSRWLSYEELLRLKVIEDILDRYYNSQRFRTSLAYLIPLFGSAFAFFETFAAWWKVRSLDEVAHKTRDLYGYLLDFARCHQADELILCNCLKYDLLCFERSVELPDWAGEQEQALAKLSYSFWKDQEQIRKYLPGYEDRPIREIQRKVYFAWFDFNPQLLLSSAGENVTLVPQVLLFCYMPEGVKTYEINLNSNVIPLA